MKSPVALASYFNIHLIVYPKREAGLLKMCGAPSVVSNESIKVKLAPKKNFEADILISRPLFGNHSHKGPTLETLASQHFYGRNFTLFYQIFPSGNALPTENSQDSNIYIYIFLPIYNNTIFVTIIAKRKYFTHFFFNHRCLDVMEYVNTDVYFTRLQVFHSIVCHHQTNSSL